MAKNMQPIAKRCKALGISPAVMGYAKKTTNRNPGSQMRKKKSEYSLQLAEKQKIPRMSAQAVGGAVGRNPISIIVPCHRVIGADGSLTGYAGGVDRKIRLLALERQGTKRR